MEDEQNKTLESLQTNESKFFTKRCAKWRNYNEQQA